MTHIFISYAREDRETAKALAKALADQGWSVWSDSELRHGEDWGNRIERELASASRVIVLLSTTSITNSWVKAEAAEALARGVLVPALIEAGTLPLSFRSLQAADLTTWQGDERHPGFQQLLANIRRVGLSKNQDVSSHPQETSVLFTSTQRNTPIQLTLTIDQDHATYTVVEANYLIDRLSEILDLPERPRILNIEKGSVKITIEIPIEQAQLLLSLQQKGMLNQLGIKGIEILGDAVAAAILENKRVNGDYDIFMCHNVNDKREVKRIGIKLRSRGMLPWLDEWEIRPGFPWQKELENQINNIKSVGVFVGESGIGPWQNMEVDAFIRQFVKRQCPIIPAILRSCKDDPAIPPFLNGITWIDFRKKNPDPYECLIWGITGKKPVRFWKKIKMTRPSETGPW